VLDIGPRQQAEVDRRAERQGLAAVVRDVRLLRRRNADEAEAATEASLLGLWERLTPLLREAPSAERQTTRESFGRYCAAAAHRRVRQRQILVVAYGVLGVVAAVPTVGLIALALDPARPVALIAYLLTTLALAGPAWLALRSQRMITAGVFAVIAGLLCATLRPRPARGTWWDPRIVLAAADTDQRRLAAGIMMGAALTVLLIIVALISASALTLVARSRPGGGASDVRAFDHFIAVIKLLMDTPHRPGDNRRMRIQDGVRTAKIALLVMARGGRPVGWRGRWHSRAHRRELRAKARGIIKKIDRSNPLSGLREVDDELLATIVTCLIGICHDQLGDVSQAFEEAVPAPDAPPDRRRAPRVSAATGRLVRQILGMVLPLAILVMLLGTKFPMPGAVATSLAGFCALVLVVGAFWVVFPESKKSLAGFKTMASSVKSIRSDVEKIVSAVGTVDPSSKNPGAGASDSEPEQ
jgi:hypothetical protein